MAKYEFKFPLNFLRGLVKMVPEVDGLVFCHGPKRQYVRVHYPPNPNRIVGPAEQRTRDKFKNAVVLWHNLTYVERDLYKRYAYDSSGNKRCGWNIFVQDYVKLAKVFDVLQLDKLFWKMFELWRVGASKDFAFQKAIQYVAENH